MEEDHTESPATELAHTSDASPDETEAAVLGLASAGFGDAPSAPALWHSAPAVSPTLPSAAPPAEERPRSEGEAIHGRAGYKAWLKEERARANASYAKQIADLQAAAKG